MKLLNLLLETKTSTKNSYITLDKSVIDKIRKRNKNLDKELNNPIYKVDDRVYAKGGAARLALLIYVDMLNKTDEHGDDIVRDSDYVFIEPDSNYWLDRGNEFKKALSKARSFDYHIEEISKDDYFKSRDFTVNSALLNPKELSISRRAIKDAMDKEIVDQPRFTIDNQYSDEMLDYIKKRDGNYKEAIDVNVRAYLRAMLFAVRYNFKTSYNQESLFNNLKDVRRKDRLLQIITLLKAFELGIEDKYVKAVYPFFHRKAVEMLKFLLAIQGSIWGISKPGVDALIKNTYDKKEDGTILLKSLFSNYPDIKKEFDKYKSNKEKDEELYNKIINYKQFLKKQNRVSSLDNNYKKTKYRDEVT
jgi:hypothetical protein